MVTVVHSWLMNNIHIERFILDMSQMEDNFFFTTIPLYVSFFICFCFGHYKMVKVTFKKLV